MATPAKFAARIRALADGVELQSGEAVKDAAAAALVTLVRVTPVGGPPTSPRDPHPGLARSNWHVLVGDQSASALRSPTTETEAVANGIAAARALATTDGTISISNPTPYINALNSGSSLQAPAGFVDAAIAAAAAAASRARLLKRITPGRR